jgi:sialate O-acetylesterase
MAVIIDIGDSHNIHPTNKQDVGLRLSLAARALTYHQPVEYSGPMFRSAAQEGSAMRVYFTHAEGMQSLAAAQSRASKSPALTESMPHPRRK